MNRGLRNNNPLNIRHSASHWQGARAVQTDGSFVQFNSMAYGYRAAWRVLESYWKHFTKEREPFNVTNIISRWAPPVENDTKNYIRTVLMLSGLGGNENFPQPSRGGCYERMERLLRAMTTMECGIAYQEVDVQAIRQGFNLAFPDRNKQKEQPVKRAEYADMCLSKMPDMKGTTFEDWDEYWNW